MGAGMLGVDPRPAPGVGRRSPSYAAPLLRPLDLPSPPRCASSPLRSQGQQHEETAEELRGRMAEQQDMLRALMHKVTQLESQLSRQQQQQAGPPAAPRSPAAVFSPSGCPPRLASPPRCAPHWASLPPPPPPPPLPLPGHGAFPSPRAPLHRAAACSDTVDALRGTDGPPLPPRSGSLQGASPARSLLPSQSLAPLVEGLNELINDALASPAPGGGERRSQRCSLLRTPPPSAPAAHTAERRSASGSGEQALLRHQLRQLGGLSGQLAEHIGSAPPGAPRRSQLEALAKQSELLQHEATALLHAGGGPPLPPDGVMPPSVAQQSWDALESDVSRWRSTMLDLRALLGTMCSAPPPEPPPPAAETTPRSLPCGAGRPEAAPAPPQGLDSVLQQHAEKLGELLSRRAGSPTGRTAPGSPPRPALRRPASPPPPPPRGRASPPRGRASPPRGTPSRGGGGVSPRAGTPGRRTQRAQSPPREASSRRGAPTPAKSTPPSRPRPSHPRRPRRPESAGEASPTDRLLGGAARQSQQLQRRGGGLRAVHSPPDGASPRRPPGGLYGDSAAARASSELSEISASPAASPQLRPARLGPRPAGSPPAGAASGGARRSPAVHFREAAPQQSFLPLSTHAQSPPAGRGQIVHQVQRRLDYLSQLCGQAPPSAPDGAPLPTPVGRVSPRRAPLVPPRDYASEKQMRRLERFRERRRRGPSPS